MQAVEQVGWGRGGKYVDTDGRGGTFGGGVLSSAAGVSMTPQPQVADFAGRHCRQVVFPVTSGVDLLPLPRHLSVALIAGVALRKNCNRAAARRSGEALTGDDRGDPKQGQLSQPARRKRGAGLEHGADRAHPRRARSQRKHRRDEDLARVWRPFRRYITPNLSDLHAPRTAPRESRRSLAPSLERPTRTTTCAIAGNTLPGTSGRELASSTRACRPGTAASTRVVGNPWAARRRCRCMQWTRTDIAQAT